MNTAAKLAPSVERARKPQVRGKLRAAAQILAVRELRKALQEVSAVVDKAAARAEAYASLASSMDRSEEHESPFFCYDCQRSTLECVCEPHGWEE